MTDWSIPHAAAAFAAFAILSACGGSDVVPTEPIRVEGAAAAIVNGEKIYVSDVEIEAAYRGLVTPGDTFRPDKEEYKTILAELVDQKLMAQEARARGLAEDPAARRRLELAEERILGNLLVESLVASEVTEARIEDMYDQQVSLQQFNDEVSIAHILMETRTQADYVHQEITENGRRFESLVVSNSIDTATRMENGDMGYVSPNDQPAPFPRVIAETAVGEVSQPFQTDRGWHILKVKDRRTQAPKSRAEMRPEIVTFLTLNEVSKILRRLRTEAEVEQGVPGADLPLPPDVLPDSGEPESITPQPTSAPKATEL